MPDTMQGLVVVALPEETDHVWDLSSQKVPHMTILYFGQPSWDAEQLLHVTEFVEHASTMIQRFGMSVERRGELGADGADVLFFRKNWSYKKIAEFRDNLLTERNMHEAFLKADQYLEWTPHLTLGYPDSPAKPETRDWPIGWVDFDRISLWTGEFEGPTFQLKEQFDLDMAMSQLQKGSAEIQNILEHYGVKGQKWGVRRNRSRGGGSNKTRTTFKKAPSKLSDAELAKRIERMQIEKKYNELNRRDVSNGQKLVSEILTGTGRRVATTVLTGASLVAIRTALTSRFGEAVAGEVTRRLK